MRRTTLALLLALSPGYLAAQSQSASNTPAPPANGLSVETRARLEALLALAREKNVPTEPMTNRIAEGQAKGASDAQIIASVARSEAQLVASQEALVRAGHEPSDAEVARGAEILASGASSTQLEALARHAPSERRLVVAFEVLTQLTARGVPVDRALAVIGAELQGGAGDGQLIALTASANGQAHAGANGGIGSQSGAAGLAGTLSSGLGIGLVRKP